MILPVNLHVHPEYFKLRLLAILYGDSACLHHASALFSTIYSNSCTIKRKPYVLVAGQGHNLPGSLQPLGA